MDFRSWLTLINASRAPGEIMYSSTTQLRKKKYNNIIMTMFSRSKRIRFYAVKGILKRVKCIKIYTSWCRTYCRYSREALHTGHLCSEIRNVRNDSILYTTIYTKAQFACICGDAILYNTQTRSCNIYYYYITYTYIKLYKKRIFVRIK